LTECVQLIVAELGADVDRFKFGAPLSSHGRAASASVTARGAAFLTSTEALKRLLPLRHAGVPGIVRAGAGRCPGDASHEFFCGSSEK
jgi:hypothetical protein